MSAGPTDPRVELTINDLMMLAAALSIALPSISKADRVRYQALATKLATIVIRAQQWENAQRADREG